MSFFFAFMIWAFYFRVVRSKKGHRYQKKDIREYQEVAMMEMFDNCLMIYLPTFLGSRTFPLRCSNDRIRAKLSTGEGDAAHTHFLYVKTAYHKCIGGLPTQAKTYLSHMTYKKSNGSLV